jgi:HAD superfamily hydrolase (TIGR01509 family)
MRVAVCIRALLWDVDGVLAETERDGHRIAFNAAFAAHGLPWHWSVERYGELLAISGGRERLLHDMGTQAEAPKHAGERDALASALHQTKNRLYAERLDERGIPLREGVRELMDECRSGGVRMGICTTTSRSNLDALLRAHFGDEWAAGFAVQVCGEDVARKKPDPEAYERALQALQIDPLEALAIEDSPGGVAAARAAGVPVIVTRSVYFAATAIEGAAAIGPSLGQRAGWQPAPATPGLAGRITLDDLRDFHRRETSGAGDAIAPTSATRGAT